jgi:hypothetical protein
VPFHIINRTVAMAGATPVSWTEEELRTKVGQVRQYSHLGFIFGAIYSMALSHMIRHAYTRSVSRYQGAIRRLVQMGVETLPMPVSIHISCSLGYLKSDLANFSSCSLSDFTAMRQVRTSRHLSRSTKSALLFSFFEMSRVPLSFWS